MLDGQSDVENSSSGRVLCPLQCRAESASANEFERFPIGEREMGMGMAPRELMQVTRSGET